MSAARQDTLDAARGRAAASEETAAGERRPSCPACNQPTRGAAIERHGKYQLFPCSACGLQFWEPREMPDASWYEQMYGGRDVKLLPLEPGHKYFLRDPLAPGCGELLEIGCGTGNFLAAARSAGYSVTGTELDRNAARFAKDRLGLPRILPLSIAEFVKQQRSESFDIVTFFEVLEHQARPVEFLEQVKSCLRPRGYVALSVPNRERWLTGPDVLDHPPNHFLRWDAGALRSILIAQEFEILSLREQSAGVRHTAQMINMSLRTGLMRTVAGESSASFRDVMQMPPEQAAALQRAPTMRESGTEMLGRLKFAACFPLAIAAYPYVRARGHKGTYLYCLGRLKN